MASRKLNRAEVVDENFIGFVNQYTPAARDLPDGLTATDVSELFDSQMASRQLDLMARELRLENKVFYTIGSSGHEGNAMVGRLSRHTDPAFLHYRSGGFMAERSRKLDGIDFIADTALSFAASSQDPASGGRHKVWGSKPLWVLPQTSTIASHLPKAVGTALAIGRKGSARAAGGHELPVPEDAIVICSFGDAGANHSTAQGAFNAAAWAAHQGLPAPIVFVCEDNELGISVRTPRHWIEQAFADRHGLAYVQADGLDLASGYSPVGEAIDHCRHQRRPVFLHLKTTRLMGHAGTDFEIDYRSQQDLEAAEAKDPLLTSAALVMDLGLMDDQAIIQRYQSLREECLAKAREADTQPRLTSLEAVANPLAPISRTRVSRQAESAPAQEQRIAVFGTEADLPEKQSPRHMAVNINRALADLLIQYPQALVFGEDVAQKGGVYTVTKSLKQSFGPGRVFNTLLDEQTILGLAQGYANMGYLPLPEIQYLAYFHNACDQIRGEAASLQYFSNNQYQNPMVVRIASLGYQKGFGGHFHNDNSIAALRDIPGLTIACPSRGDDAVGMLRTLMAMARVDGRVSAFLEPIALYMTKDLYQADDGQWQFHYPAPGSAVALGAPRIYQEEATDLLIITYGNGVPMSLRCARRLARERDVQARVMDLRWLAPLNQTAIVSQASQCQAVLVVDEGRRSGGISEAIITAMVEGCDTLPPISRVVGADCFTPLGDAAKLVLPSDQSVFEAALASL